MRPSITTSFEIEPLEEDLRPPTPEEPVEPILNIAEESAERNQDWRRAQDEYRPYIQVATKQRYTEVECQMYATGYRLSIETADQIRQLQKQREQKAKDNPDHKSQTMTVIDDNRRIVRLKTCFLMLRATTLRKLPKSFVTPTTGVSRT